MADQVRILIVDDDLGNALLAEDAIKDYFGQCSTDTASSGEECQRFLRERKYDVVLLDQNLPDIAGLALYNSYRESGIDVPTIMVTGSGDEETAVEAMKAGVYDYVVKTADLGYLKALPLVVRDSMRRRQMEQELARSREREVELERLRAVREIVVSLSHEINNPLAVVLGTTQMLLQYPSQEFTEETVGQLKAIEKDALRIRELVRKLSRVNRLYTTQYAGIQTMIDVEKSSGMPDERHPEEEAEDES